MPPHNQDAASLAAAAAADTETGTHIGSAIEGRRSKTQTRVGESGRERIDTRKRAKQGAEGKSQAARRE